MVQKLITMLVIFLFLALAIVGLQAVFGGSSNGVQEISHNMAYHSIPTDFTSTAVGASLLYAGMVIFGSRSIASWTASLG